MQTGLSPLITETTLSLAKGGWYTFIAPVSENKYNLRKLINKIFKVEVLEIKTMIVKGKSRRSAKTRKVTRLPDWKKVLVKIKEGQKIDSFEVGA